MEPVFVPRPVVLVDRLPRNELGKTPREALLQMLHGEKP
jgi:acyl-coenzyme A synthetase/AMP-(fatty) acid ligase